MRSRTDKCRDGAKAMMRITSPGGNGVSRAWMFRILNGLGVAMLCGITDFLSPLYPDDWSLWDADIFRVVGKAWAQGGIPYVDAWDSKGPLVFFTHMIGYYLGGPIHGVFIIDLAMALSSALFLWKIVDLTCGCLSLPIRTFVFWLCIIALALMLIPSWDMTEAICLPFLSASLSLMLRSIRTMSSLRRDEVRPYEAYVHGLALSVCAMTRITNGIVVCVGVLVLTCLLVMRKRWANLMACAAAFIGGCATLSVPFSVYFAVHHAWDEFLYGTFLYNVDYAASSRGMFLATHSPLTFCAFAIPVMCTVCAACVMVRRRRCESESMLYFIAGAASSIMFFNLEPYLHYYVITVVFVPFVASALTELMDQRRTIAGMLAVTLMCGTSLLAYRTYRLAVSPLRTSYESVAVEKVVRQSHGSVGIYGGRAMLYLRYDLKPRYPYFCLQEWQSSFSDEFGKRMVAAYERPKSRHLLVYTNIHRRLLIQDALDAHYLKMGATGPNQYGTELILYRAKGNNR